MDKLLEELFTRLVLISDWLDTGHHIKDDQQNILLTLDQVCLAVQEGRLTTLPITGESLEPSQTASMA